jgi:hypothetical protein
MQLSARNQIPARVTGINAGEAIANVELEANGVRWFSWMKYFFRTAHQAVTRPAAAGFRWPWARGK